MATRVRARERVRGRMSEIACRRERETCEKDRCFRMRESSAPMIFPSRILANEKSTK